MSETTEISLFLHQNELDCLALLPGTTEKLVEQAIEFFIETPGAMCGAWGGPMPKQYPLRLNISTDLVRRLRETTGQPAEYALRCWMAAIPRDYLRQRQALLVDMQPPA